MSCAYLISVHVPATNTDFFFIFDYTGSTMKNSASNFRQKLNYFQKSDVLFPEKKTFRSSNS